MRARIYLTGFMTSGKSTIGPILANVLGLEFVDLDKFIETAEKKTIVEIFDTSGEQYFRDIERKALNDLSLRNNLVIALGGGTMSSQENVDLMQQTGKIIYLKVSPEALYKRLKNKTDRPLFRDLVLNNSAPEEFASRISEIFEKRKIFYEKADFTVRTDIDPIGVTVDRLAKKLKEYLNEED